jgi:hypothetical protein
VHMTFLSHANIFFLGCLLLLINLY